METEYPLEVIKEFAPHLKVQGAYVQQPVAALYGLEEDIAIGSNDADALYPISIMHQNIGYDTLHSRIYDTGTIKQILYLIETVFQQKSTNPEVIISAVNGFKTALHQTLREYFSRKSVAKKKETQEFIINYYSELLYRLLKYDGALEDIYEPKDDFGYVLLQSYLFPILETVSWLSPQNRGYNQTVVKYVFFNEEYMRDKPDVYVMVNINSTKTQFKKLKHSDAVALFQSKILNPYGVLFDKHDDNLAFDVTLINAGLDDRKKIKNKALVLGALLSSWKLISDKHIQYFLNPGNRNKLSVRQANEILEAIEDTQNRAKRIESLTDIEFKIDLPESNDRDKCHIFIALRESQFNSMQLGIKVTLNSLYGIYGLITWQYSSPIIGNAITTAGKIYGIKLFQEVTTRMIDDLNSRIEKGEYNGITKYQRKPIK